MKHILAVLLFVAMAAAQYPVGTDGGAGGTGAPNATFVWTGSSATGDILHTFSAEAAAKAVIICYSSAGAVLPDTADANTKWTRSDPDATHIRITFAGAQPTGTKCNANATGTGSVGATGATGADGANGGTGPAGADGVIQYTFGNLLDGTANEIAVSNVVKTWDAGAGDPSGACTAGQEDYLNATSTNLFRCSDDGTWRKLWDSGNVHTHADASNGGTLNASAVAAGTLPVARGGTNAASFTPSRCLQSSADGSTIEVAAFICGSGTGGGSGIAPATALLASGTSLVVTHNAALSNIYAFSYSCFDEDDASSVTPLTATGATNAVTFAFSATVTNVRCTVLTSIYPAAKKVYGASFFNGGSALLAATSIPFSIPTSCTAGAWTISVDAGTATVKYWKVATGTAIPTIADVINTSGISISTGTHIRSTTMSDFTDTSWTAGDVFRVALTAVATATMLNVGVECQE